MTKKSLIIGIILLLLFCNISFKTLSDENSGNLSGKTLYVDDDAQPPWLGTKDYPFKTITQALKSAQSGDTIFVFNGTYNESIIMDKKLTLIGESNISTTINWPFYEHETINITGDSVIIKNFNITQGRIGIFMWSSFNLIENNRFNNMINQGIVCFGSNNTLRNNCIQNTSREGIYLLGNNNHINGNLFDLKWKHAAIRCRDCSQTLIENNLIKSKEFGIYFYKSENNFVYNNTMISCGIMIDELICGDLPWFQTMENNTVNGKPLYYFKNNHTGGIISGEAGQIMLANCSNFTICNVSIDRLNDAILIGFSSECTICNCRLTDNTRNILLYKSSDINVSNNDLINCWSGIFLEKCKENITVYNNTFRFDKEISLNDAFHGIYAKSSSYNLFINNYFFDMWQGIELFDGSSGNSIINNDFDEIQGWFDFCKTILIQSSENNRIENNTMNKCKNGISLESYDTENTIVRNNYISNIELNGIEISRSSNNIIEKNTIVSCDENGILIGPQSEGNILYHNNLIDNSNNGFDISNNKWYHQGNGNYWDDYLGIDADNDGIGDVSYSIPGGGNQDKYPLMKPYNWEKNPPFVDIVSPAYGLYFDNKKILNLPNTIIAFGKLIIQVDANDFDSGIENVQINYKNFLFEYKESITTEPYVFTWDKPCFGKWDIEVIAFDKAGNIASDNIEVWKFF